MSNRIYGHFYFKQTTTGNLLGEYGNEGKDSMGTESSECIERKSQPFEGTYHTCWLEGTAPQFLWLKIVKPETGLYELLWSRKEDGSSPVFSGRAERCDDLLIGHYKSC